VHLLLCLSRVPKFQKPVGPAIFLVLEVIHLGARVPALGRLRARQVNEVGKS
jgi:hypothetical protein